MNRPIITPPCPQKNPRQLHSALQSLRWFLIFLGCLLGASGLQAQNGIWTSTASGGLWGNTGNWSGGTVADGTGNTADFNQVNLTTDPTVVHLDSNRTIGNLIFGDTNTNSAAGWLLDDNGSAGANILTLDNGAASSLIAVNSLGGGKAVTLGPILAGTVGLTKTGNGTLVLTNVNTLSGTVAVSKGALTLDFTAGTTTILNSPVLNLWGGTLNLIGNAASASSQTFASTTLNAATSAINVPLAAGGSPTLALNAITVNQGGSVVFSGPSTSTGVSSSTGQTGATGNADPVTGAVASTANITTASALVGNSIAGGYFATVGLYDFATTSAGTVIGLSQGTGGAGTDGAYSIPANGGNLAGGNGSAGFNDVVVASVLAPATADFTLIRFNAPVASTVDSKNASNWGVSGILLTPNVGANNINFTNTTVGNTRTIKIGNHTANANLSLVIWQNNTAGLLNLFIGISGSAGNRAVVQNGPGTVAYPNFPSSYTAQTYLNGGATEIISNGGLGAPATAAAVNLNGGTVVGAATLTLDNAGANFRPVNVLTNGGGLSALNGFTMTVNGVVGGASGTGPLTIGIPASANNGNVLGQVPGTGSGTANAQQLATGIVVLNNTGNTYTGGTIVSSGTLQLGAASVNVLGTGNLTLNGGGFQWGSGLTTDISSRTVTIGSLGGTLDANGNSVALANPVGNGGNGALIVKSSALNGVLTLSAANTYTGGTTVSSGSLLANNTSGSATGSGSVTVASGATLGGTGIISGTITWQSGAKAAFTQGSPLAVSGAVTLNNNSVTVNVPGGTPLGVGTYTLMTYNNTGSSGSFNSATPTFTGAGVAGGTIASVTTSAGAVTLSVVAAGVAGTWNVDADGNWSTGANWSSNPSVPHAAGDGATFGTGSVLRTVNLDVNETVGSIAMNNNNSFLITNVTKTLTLDNTGNGAAINVIAGTANGIQSGVSLKDNVTASVSSGKSLAIAGNIVNTTTAKTLTVNGAGTLALSGNNSYGPSAGSVGTTVSAGTLQVGSSSALGGGDVSVPGSSTLQAVANGLSLGNNLDLAPSVTLSANNGGNTFTLGGIISDNGALSAVGSGKLVLNGNNTYTGGTIVNSGTVSISSDGAAGGNPGNLGTVPNSAAANNVVLNGGGLLGSATLGLNVNRGIGIGPIAGLVGGNGLIDAASGQTFTINGNITSAGNNGTNVLVLNSVASTPGTVVLANANTFSGTTTISNGVLQLANAAALQNSTLNYSSGTLDFGVQTNVTLGGLAGTKNLGLTNASGAAVALAIGNHTTSSSYSGILGGAGSLSKRDPGAITIGSGASGGANYTGQTLVEAGTLTLGGVGNMTTVSNVQISGNQLAANASLNIVDSAVLTTTGAILLNGTGGGNGFPNAATLTLANNANVSAARLSFGGPNTTLSGANNVIGAGDFVTVQDNASLTVAGSFDLNNTRSGTSAASNDRLNLNGGLLAAGNFLATSGSGVHQSTINFNGGILKANASDPTNGSAFLPALAGLTVNLTNRAIIDSAAFNITIAANLVNTPGNPDNGLVKLGTGTLKLTGANTYNGLTTVSNGALYISTALQSGTESFMVNDGKTFGAINNVGGQSAQVVNLTMGNNSGPTTLVFTNVSDLSAPVINLTSGGVMALNGNCTITIADATSLVATNEYPLIGYAGGSIVTNSGTGFTLTLPPGVTGTLTNDPAISAIALIVTHVPVIPPTFSSVSVSGSDFLLNATGGSPGASLSVLTSTNLALPLAAWTTVTTGSFDGSGNFSYTVSGALSSGLPQQFYILQTP